jgi:hypothetical protein
MCAKHGIKMILGCGNEAIARARTFGPEESDTNTHGEPGSGTANPEG